jgi:ABC-2 type transport system ATP-binding protein
MLKFQSVKKSYGSVLVLDIPSLTLGNGIYWLKGSNGTGKSTVLKMIAGMIPFEGEIELSGVNPNTQPVGYRRLVNYVEAEPLYPPFLSGSDLVHFFQRVRNAPVNQIERLQAKFGITPFVTNAVHTYSSGMIKKLSLVLAFTGNPDLILLDEPLVTIDKDTIPILYSLITEYAARGTNFIIASHQPLEQEFLPAISVLSVLNHQLLQE